MAATRPPPNRRTKISRGFFSDDDRHSLAHGTLPWLAQCGSDRVAQSSDFHDFDASNAFDWLVPALRLGHDCSGAKPRPRRLAQTTSQPVNLRRLCSSIRSHHTGLCPQSADDRAEGRRERQASGRSVGFFSTTRPPTTWHRRCGWQGSCPHRRPSTAMTYGCIGGPSRLEAVRRGDPWSLRRHQCLDLNEQWSTALKGGRLWRRPARRATRSR